LPPILTRTRETAQKDPAADLTEDPTDTDLTVRKAADITVLMDPTAKAMAADITARTAKDTACIPT
jgi:hypothetical protein